MIKFNGRNILALYFGYERVAGHGPECPKSGTDQWEVTRHVWSSFDGATTETTIRLACHECGNVAFLDFDQEESFHSTSAARIGYGSKPERAGRLWLWPGPILSSWSEDGPTSYYATWTRERPRAADDVVGVIGWRMGPRGGIRWDALIGLTKYGNGVESVASGVNSRRKAAMALEAAATAAALDAAADEHRDQAAADA